MKYRYNHIEGLRTIAVLAVVIFHASNTLLPSGNAGVDIFFVISGFLITNSLLESKGSFSERLASFYLSRIRRILPATLTLLIGLWFFGAAILTPNEFKTLGEHGLWSLVFLQNWNLYFEIGYFDFASTLKPLLHLWSLSVEEQFYLLWPLIVLSCVSVVGRNLRTSGLRHLPTVLVALIVSSFCYSSHLASTNPSLGFYSSFSRAWELGIGASIAIFTSKNGGLIGWQSGFWLSRYPRFSNVVNLASLLLLVGLLFVEFEKNYQPPWFLGVICLLSVLQIILPSQGRNDLLSSGTCIFVGAISFSLYLWHWPFLVFYSLSLQVMPSSDIWYVVLPVMVILSALLTFKTATVVLGSKQLAAKTTVILCLLAAIGVTKITLQGGFIWIHAAKLSFLAAAYCLACSSYLLVENRLLRKSKNVVGERIKYPIVLLASLLIATYFLNGFPVRADFKGLEPDIEIFTKLSRKDCPITMEKGGYCAWTGDNPKKVNRVFLGDSHAASLFLGAQVLPGDTLLLGRGGCQPFPETMKLIVDYLKGNVSETRKCLSAVSESLRFIKLLPKDVEIWLIGRWAIYATGEGFGLADYQSSRAHLNYEQLSMLRSELVKEFMDVVREIHARGNPVKIIMQVPELKINPINCQRYRPIQVLTGLQRECNVDLKSFSRRTDSYSFLLDATKFQFMDQVDIIDLGKFLCDEFTCHASDRGGNLLYTDDDHLNRLGASTLLSEYSRNVMDSQ